MTSRRVEAAALGGYLLLAFLYLGLAPLVERGPQYVGYGYDPSIFIWAFAWWPHAILHGENPFVTHAVWAPDGVNLVWATSVPGLALVFAPLTLLAGAALSYDVAAVLMPALAAWTAFLLCRHLTRALWPSLVGGYLFGFSSYVLGQGGGGHLHLSSVFALPLVALVLLRFVEGTLGARGLVVRLAPLLALELLLSTEVSFTLALALAATLVLAFVLVPERRARLAALIPPVAAAYAVAALLAAPFVFYALAGFHSAGYSDQDAFTADLANLVVPTKITAAGGGWFHALASRFPANPSEQGLYVGLPVLAVVALYAWQRRRSAGGRFLLACFLLALLLALGPKLTVAGHTAGWLPWALVHRQPLFDNVLTARLALYVTLAAAVVVALWTARARGLLRVALPALALLALVPDPHRGGFATTYHVPALFTAAAYRDCLDPGEVVVPFPFRGGSALLWQVDRGFRFRMAGGDLGPDIPASFLTADALPVTGGGPLGADNADQVRSFLAAHGVTTVVVDARDAAQWSPALDLVTRPRRSGGALLYRLRPYPPPCPP